MAGKIVAAIRAEASGLRHVSAFDCGWCSGAMTNGGETFASARNCSGQRQGRTLYERRPVPVYAHKRGVFASGWQSIGADADTRVWSHYDPPAMEPLTHCPRLDADDPHISGWLNLVTAVRRGFSLSVWDTPDYVFTGVSIGLAEIDRYTAARMKADHAQARAHG